MRRPPLPGVTTLFFRVGVTVFGGGDPTIAILQREFYRRDWLTPEKFAIAFGLARLTPGTNVLAFCAAAGWYMLGLTGALGTRSLVDPRLRSHHALPPGIVRRECPALRCRRHHDRRGSAAGPNAVQTRPLAQTCRHLDRRVPSGIPRQANAAASDWSCRHRRFLLA